jgi:hypothetical protein
MFSNVPQTILLNQVLHPNNKTASFAIIQGHEHKHFKSPPHCRSSLLGGGELYFHIKRCIKYTEIAAGEFDNSHL